MKFIIAFLSIVFGLSVYFDRSAAQPVKAPAEEQNAQVQTVVPAGQDQRDRRSGDQAGSRNQARETYPTSGRRLRPARAQRFAAWPKMPQPAGLPKAPRAPALPRPAGAPRQPRAAHPPSMPKSTLIVIKKVE